MNKYKFRHSAHSLYTFFKFYLPKLKVLDFRYINCLFIKYKQKEK